MLRFTRETVVDDLAVMDFYPSFGQNTDIGDMLITVQELKKGLRVCEFASLDLVGTLAKLAPHGVPHKFGQRPLPVVLVDVGRFQRIPLSSLVGGDVGDTFFLVFGAIF